MGRPEVAKHGHLPTVRKLCKGRMEECLISKQDHVRATGFVSWLMQGHVSVQSWPVISNKPLVVLK